MIGSESGDAATTHVGPAKASGSTIFGSGEAKAQKEPRFRGD
jgi:hypothetical protein